MPGVESANALAPSVFTVELAPLPGIVRESANFARALELVTNRKVPVRRMMTMQMNVKLIRLTTKEHQQGMC